MIKKLGTKLSPRLSDSFVTYQRMDLGILDPAFLAHSFLLSLLND